MIQRVGPYRIVRRIGAGGMGEVFEAVHEELGRHVALKLLRPEAMPGVEAQRRFRREMQTGAALIHPNLVRLYDGGTLDDTLYMAMELVEGETLADRLARERPPLAWTIRVARQIAAGLACLHAQEICHRDVKPQNILLDRDGAPKIADFGLVRTVEGTAITADGCLAGTLAFISPELLQGAPVTPAADVWALGCVLYMMLCGRGPFLASGPTELYQAIASQPIRPVEELVPNIPPAVAQVVARLLDRRPEARISSAAEVASALSGLSSTELRVVKRRSGANSIKPVPQSRDRRPLAALAVAAAVVAGASAHFALRKEPPPPPTRATPAPERIVPGHPAWARDVVARSRALEPRDPRQSVAVVLDALQELGRAAPNVPWPKELDDKAWPVVHAMNGRFVELRNRGKLAYERATMEFAGDVPRRERAFASELRTMIRDLMAIVPSALRADAPFYMAVGAGQAVETALGVEFRLLDGALIGNLERDVKALCVPLDATWRGPYMSSFAQGRSSERVPERRRALTTYERELAARGTPPTEADAVLWHELALSAIGACALTQDRVAGQELFEHASRYRIRLPAAKSAQQKWTEIQAYHQLLAKGS